MVSSSSHVFSNSTLVEVLDDLCVRFIINLPAEEICSVERVCFQIEEAQWYYEDFVRAHNPSFPTLNLRAFSAKIFQHCPSLQEWKDQHEEAFAQFMAYKTRVPVRGAIMLNPELDQCVLVKGMKSSASWSFPRGKINQDETDMDCAVREVLEETGFDASDMVQPEDFIEITMRSQNMKLYIIPGVPLDTVFAPKTRNEIGTIQWHNLSDLPTFSKKKANEGPVRMGKFYMVAPFLYQLRKWISTKGEEWLAAQEELPNKENIAPVQCGQDFNAPVEDGFTTDSALSEDPSTSLRNLLGINKPDPTPHLHSNDPSLKLKNFLRLGEVAKEEVKKPTSEEDRVANGQALLSILQNGPNKRALEDSPVFKHRPDPEPIRIMSRPEPPETPTRPPAMPSPHSSLLHHVNYQRHGQVRTPLSPLQHVRSLEQQSPSVYQQPPPPAPQFSPRPVNQGPMPMSSTQPTKSALSEQASALLQTLKGGPPQQIQPKSASTSPLDSFFPVPQPQKPPDSQHSKSLLSILKGESSPTLSPQSVNAPFIRSPVLAGNNQQTQVQRVQATPTPAPSTPHTSQPSRSELPFRPSSIPSASRDPRTSQNTTPKLAAVNAYRAKQSQSSPATPPSAKIPGVGIGQFQQKPNLPVYPQGSYNDYGLRGIQAQNSHIAPPLPSIAPPVFDRRESVSNVHQQSLLSLFKDPDMTSPNKVTSPTTANIGGSAVMSSPEISVLEMDKGKGKERVQPSQIPSFKMATGGISGGSSVTGKSPIGMGFGGMGLGMSSRKSSGSGGSDAFLLSYLENVAKGAGK